MTPPTSTDTAPRRRRPPLACIQCRRRKVRCDRNFPCTPCRRARESLACSYSPNNDNQELTSVPIASSASTRIPRLSGTRKRSITSVLSGEDGENAGNLGVSSAPPPNTELIEDLQRRIRQLEELIARGGTSQFQAGLGSSHPSTTPTQNTVRRPSPIRRSHSSRSEQLQASENPSITAPLPRLRVSQEKCKLFGANHWLNTAAQFQVIGDFTARDVEFSFARDDMAEFSSILRECYGFRRSHKTQLSKENTLPTLDLPSTFPRKALCDELVQCYMRTLEPIYRLFHIPSFWKEYEEFWSDPQASPSQFVMKLGLILAIGDIFHSDQQSSENVEILARKWIYTAQWWLIGPSESTTFNLDGIQICCLIILSRQVGCLSAPLWISAESLLRMAMMIGLHRNTSLFPILSPFQSEMRNRLWAAVVELSVQSVMDSGVPCPLSLENIDSGPPSNINDEDISPDSKEQVDPKGSQVLTDTSIQVILGRSIRVRLEIARLINKTFRADLTYDTALKLGNELRAACREISAFFQANQSRLEAHETRVTDFHRRFLDMMLRRYIIFLHRPFMIEARKDPRYYLSRKVCVESCMIIASYTEKLDVASEDSKDISRLTLAGNGSFKGPLCMDVISVLGLELMMQLEEENSIGASHHTLRTGTDPLDEMTRASREPLIKCLERIRDQSEQTLASGIPSLKRYNYVNVVMSLIRAKEFGLPLKQTINEDMTSSLKTCLSLLKKSQADRNQNITTETLSNDLGDLPSLFSMEDWDLSSEMDFSSFIGLSGLLDQSSSLGW